MENVQFGIIFTEFNGFKSINYRYEDLIKPQIRSEISCGERVDAYYLYEHGKYWAFDRKGMLEVLQQVEDEQETLKSLVTLPARWAAKLNAEAKSTKEELQARIVELEQENDDLRDELIHLSDYDV